MVDSGSGIPLPVAETRVPRQVRLLRAVVIITCIAYVVSVLPGVRAEPGYSVVWEVGFFNVVEVGAATLVLLRAVTDPARRLAWGLLGLGLGSYALGTLYFSLYLQHLDEMPYPSLADGLWLTFYPFAFASVVVLARRELLHRGSGGRVMTPLDGLIAGLGCASLAAAFAFGPITAGASGTRLAILTNFAYPVADLSLLVLVVGVLVLLGRSAGSRWWLLGCGLVAFATADSWFLLQVSMDTYSPGSPVDSVWVVAVTLVALAACRRTSAASARPDPGMAAFLVPTLSGAAAVTVLLASEFFLVSRLGVLLAAAALVVVSGRLVLALRQATLLADSRHQARTDELTGLPNRRAFYEMLTEVGTAGEPPHARAGAGGPRSRTLLLLDLDRFKDVNDALGHRVGDELLRQVARRLEHVLGGRHQVARLGGDEFAILVEGPTSTAMEVAGEVLAAVRLPYDLGVMRLHVDGSIGVADLDQQADPGRTLARADVAMYRAKGRRGGVQVYEDAVDGSAWDRLSMVEALRIGIRSGELEVDYQPLVHLATGRPSALEALVRWRHPERGRVAPDDFLPLAEQTGLMNEITRAVLNLALDHAVVLARSGVSVPVAVNLSASDLLDVTLADDVIGGLEQRGLPPDALQIEITETLLVGNRESTRTLLDRLEHHGVRLAVDDYGTGYSSLTYLHDLPVTELKIDRTFTARLLGDPRTATIVRSTIQLAHDLGLEVVAEGVESAAQMGWLADAGVDTAQGFHIARPMSGPAALQWLVRQAVPAGGLERI